jgi:phosphoribosylpyrophosphate synthetase
MTSYKDLVLVKDDGYDFSPLFSDPIAFKEIVVHLCGKIKFGVTNVLSFDDVLGSAIAMTLGAGLQKISIDHLQNNPSIFSDPGSILVANVLDERTIKIIRDLPQDVLERIKRRIVVLLCDLEWEQEEYGSMITSFFHKSAVSIVRTDGLLEKSSPIERLIPEKVHVKDPKNDCRAIVFYHPDVSSIALELCMRYPFLLRASHVDWGNFPDGWANIRFEDQDNLINRHIIFIMSAHKMNKFLEQICLLIALCRQFASSVTVIIPYFGPATMERVVNEGDLATAEPIMKLMSKPIPSTSGGLPAIVFLDIHDIRERFYPTDNVTPKLLSAGKLILDIIKEKKATIVFPDEGAYKRFNNLTQGLPVITFMKMRSGEERIMSIGSSYNMDYYGEGHDPYNNLVIWDDLVHSGGTLLECAKALKGIIEREDPSVDSKKRERKISAFVTHAVFENKGYEKFLVPNCPIEHFYVTNSIPSVCEELAFYPSRFTVLDIIPVIAPFIIERIKTNVLEANMVLSSVEHVRYVISSSSPVKEGALRDALETIVLGNLVDETGRETREETGTGGERTIHHIDCIPCPSGVSEQPWGDKETRKGVCNRHALLRKKVLETWSPWSTETCVPTVLITVENGIIEEEEGGREILVDKAFILVESFTEATKEGTIKRVIFECGRIPDECGRIPDEHVKDFKEIHKKDPNMTFGKYLKLKGEDVDENDWQATHGGDNSCSRRETLEEGLLTALGSLL